MTFKDIFTSDIISRVTAVSTVDMFMTILLSFLVGTFIFYVYKKTFNGVLYSASFGLTLISLCMIAGILILAVSSNIVLSLGMVGALSIVRFRTAIKEPLDIAFLFWALSAGIILATGMIPLAVFGTIGIGLMMLFFANRNGKDNPYLLVIHLEDSRAEKETIDLIIKNTGRSVVKGKTFQKDGKEELTIEVQLNNNESDFVKEVYKINGVEDIVMVSYNGDYMQ